MEVTAIYIGKNNLEGFENGRAYKLKITTYNGKITAMRHGKLGKPLGFQKFDNIEQFFESFNCVFRK